MKKLTVKFLSTCPEESDVHQISQLLNSMEQHRLEFAPWEAYPYKPFVSFAVSYSGSYILLKFFVQEKQIRAVNYATNGSIWEDSCVEFFISFDEGASYYNIEFNCMGTGLVGYGQSKEQRQLLDPAIVNQVKALSVIHYEKGNKANWELTLAIPFSVFVHNDIETLAKKSCKANFYKCGDLLPEPHFVAWSDIKSESPNFHLPHFFGQLIFE